MPVFMVDGSAVIVTVPSSSLDGLNVFVLIVAFMVPVVWIPAFTIAKVTWHETAEGFFVFTSASARRKIDPMKSMISGVIAKRVYSDFKYAINAVFSFSERCSPKGCPFTGIDVTFGGM